MASELWARLLGEAWTALGGEAPGTELQVTGVRGSLPSHLPVEDTAIACAGAALLAAADLQARRGGPVARTARLDRGHVAAVFRSEAYLRLNGVAAGAGFAPLSRFWPARDGWVRTHGNYPWHREALLRALGTGEDPDQVAAAIAGRAAHWLLGSAAAGLAPASGGRAAQDADWLITLGSAEGPVTVVRPPGQLDGRELAWPSPLTRYGGDPPAWR